MKNDGSPSRLVIDTNSTEDDTKAVQKGLVDYNKTHPGGDLDIPTPDISLVLKEKDSTVVGGVITSMLTGVMHLEVLWVDDKHRRQGYGRDLVLRAEEIGKAKGYKTSQTWTFSFQAPDFYQSIGYEVLGVFDGYVDGITEYVLMKRLKKDHKTSSGDSSVRGNAGSDRLEIFEDATDESMRVVRKGLGEYFSEHVGELQKQNPEVKIRLALKNDKGRVLGGIAAATVLGTMAIEHLWVDERYRGQGYGRDLLLAAERIARENGCISGQTWVLSFQAHEFFRKLGYEEFGVSDGYPNGIREFYFIKKF
ncbi:MAG: GNAT family N-acetyltransferase [Candidatus Thorarchaeota archaeon]|nr:MAG: GNAT family N-acetyltransferase [Candidatus Thorarchaeota archaeon]